jgi:hypothetical protein
MLLPAVDAAPGLVKLALQHKPYIALPPLLSAAACFPSQPSNPPPPPAGARHELLMGPERPEAVAAIVSWVNGQVAKPKL